MRDGLRRRSAGGVKALIGRIRWRTWQPNLFQGAHGYDRRALIADVIAGLTVGVVTSHPHGGQRPAADGVAGCSPSLLPAHVGRANLDRRNRDEV